MRLKHIAELDGVRALSILCVLGAHMLPLGPSWAGVNKMAGYMGMSLFFCLSGFLITQFLFDKADVRLFLVRRIARIYPLLLLYAVLVPGLFLGRWDATLGILLGYVNYDDRILGPGTGHLWSIAVELHFYLGIALAVVVAGRRGFWVVPLAAVIVMALRIESGAYHSIRTHLRVDEILSGSLLALIWLHPDHRAAVFARRLFRQAFLPVFLLWLLSCHQLGGPVEYARPYLAMAVVGAAILESEGQGVAARLRGLLRHSLLRYIAGISYALYIWHPLTMMGWLGTGDGWLRYLTRRPISFMLTFLLAHFSTTWFEAWFTAKARRYRSPREKADFPGQARSNGRT